jgi:hypothetical protein
MLKPELQSMEDFVDGINNITEVQQRVAKTYFEDRSIDSAIPPLKILLHIMANGTFEGKDISDPELRKQFDRALVIKSDWYQQRLKLKQQKDVNFLKSSIKYLKDFKENSANESLLEELQIDTKISKAEVKLKKVQSDAYLKSLVGTNRSRSAL